MKPELFQTYMDAYPNINRDGTANQWKPSKKYKEAFNTGELFGHLERAYRTLEDVFAMRMPSFAIAPHMPAPGFL